MAKKKVKKIKVAEWISYKDAGNYKEIVGGCGGFFSFGMRWDHYITDFKKEAYPYIEAIRESVVKNKLRHTGEGHQYGPAGVPLFNDGTVGTYSYRAWGDLMAAIWSEAEDKDYCYMDFYM